MCLDRYMVALFWFDVFVCYGFRCSLMFLYVVDFAVARRWFVVILMLFFLSWDFDYVKI